MKLKEVYQNVLKVPVKVLSVFLFLSIYLTGITDFDSFHDSIHHEDQSEIHSLSHESDPCHRNLFHNDSKAGCEHKSHVTAEEKCFLCGIAFYSEYLIQHHLTTPDHFLQFDHAIQPNDQIFQFTFLYKPSRAPPVKHLT